LRFLADVKSGRSEVSAPVHSHLTYDILPDQAQFVGRPDLLIVEGLNMLEAGMPEPSEGHRVFVSDYCDFSIYVDAEERYIREWHLQRFFRLREMALRDECAYMHRSMRATRRRRPRRWLCAYGTRSTTPTSKRTSNLRKTGCA
jgi:type I pantothenate kinase